MPNYTVTNPVYSGNSQQATLTDIDSASKVDVLKMLGRPAKKILVELSNGDAVTLRVNAAIRDSVPFIAGTVDINGNTSSLIAKGYKGVRGADNRCDATINRWSSGGGLEIVLSNNTGSAIVYNSYEDYGDLVINNIEFDSVTSSSGGVVTVTFVA